jgi:2-polyprenyl-3-methyl-5-hydroxy-6-metoxy-1,4-benzoquinol methylase
MKTHFYLPPRDALEPNGPDDPYYYYYHPIFGFLYRARIKQALSLLNQHYGEILELGYGSGIMIPALASIGNSVSGIDTVTDPVKAMRNLTKIGVNVSLVQGDLCDMRYQSETFDLVVAISILEHICDIEEVVKKVHNILRPGGHFLVGMPRVNDFMTVAFNAIGYRNIKAHHITNHKQFLRLSSSHFELARFARIPSWAPVFSGLYFNMLLSKRSE